MKHVFVLDAPPQGVPATVMPDGAITGNGDIGLVWGGTTDHIQLYICKVDFWKANPTSETGGGIAPFGILEILQPYMAYSPFHVEEDLDAAELRGYYTAGELDTRITVVACAVENTILLEIDSAWPGLAVSVDLQTLPGNGAVCEKDTVGGLQYITRSFDGPELYFPTAGIAVLKEVGRTKANGREVVRYSIHVCTNHDSAAYRKQAFCAAEALDDEAFSKLRRGHDAWWRKFWSASSLSIDDQDLEKGWYMGLYTLACCARNPKFPPGLWGNFATADDMGWFGDYHLNFDYYAPFPALCVANHPELVDGFDTPLYDFLPRARSFARHFLGCRGAYFPVSVGPLGMETHLKSYKIKEHNHIFLGHKTNGVHTAIAMVARWRTTHDAEYAEKVLPLLVETAEFWQDYLVRKDGKYYALNDAHSEVAWWRGPDYMPTGHDETNTTLAIGFVHALMDCLVEMCTELGVHQEDIPVWKDIAENFGPAEIKPADEKTRVWSPWHIDSIECKAEPCAPEMLGKRILRHASNSDALDSLIFEYVYPAGAVSPFRTPELYEAAQNTMRLMADFWEDERTPYCFSPAAARLGVEPAEMLRRLRYKVENKQLPNGAMRYGGGGMEDSVVVLSTLEEMMLQSYDGIVSLFPNWDLAMPARFTSWRACGAFVVDAQLEGGAFEAKIVSEKGLPLAVAVPVDGYELRVGDRRIPLARNNPSTVETAPGQVVFIRHR